MPRIFNQLFDIDKTILDNPSDKAVATWNWYLSGDEEIHEGVESFKQKGPRRRVNYGPLIDKSFKRACHQATTQWAGNKGVIQVTQNMLRLKEICLQTIVFYKENDKLNATFMLAKMKRKQSEVDFYTLYKYAQLASIRTKLPLGRVTLMVAATQDK